MAVAAITTAVLPPRVASVAMKKTPAGTAMVGAQTINMQLKAATATATETATMTETTMMMETKGMVAAAKTRQ